MKSFSVTHEGGNSGPENWIELLEGGGILTCLTQPVIRGQKWKSLGVTADLFIVTKLLSGRVEANSPHCHMEFGNFTHGSAQRRESSHFQKKERFVAGREDSHYVVFLGESVPRCWK